MLAPTSAGAPWLVVGTRTAADGRTTATVWSSPDTRTWRATSLPGADGRALAATAWGTRTVIVGSEAGDGATRAAVWISGGPGQPFAAVPDAPALDPPAATATGAGGATSSPTTAAGAAAPSGAGQAAGGAGTSAAMDVVGAGTLGVFAAGAAGGRQALWYSTDGTDWVRLPRGEAVIDAAPSSVVTSLLVAPSGVYATGTAASGTNVVGALWTSADGITWRRYGGGGNPFAGAGDHRLDGLTATPTGELVAVGAVRSGPTWVPASWISPDGGIWSQPDEDLPVPTAPQGDAGGTIARAVGEAGATTLVAVGGSRSANELWTSADGRSWTAVPLPAADASATDWSADAVATDGTTTVLVDTAPGQPRVLTERAGRWTEPSADPATFGSPATVATPVGLVARPGRLVLLADVTRPAASVGPTSTDAVVLTSSGTAGWSRVPTGRTFAGADVAGLDVVGTTLVAVGSVADGAGRTTAAVWTSPDGRRWTRAATLGPAGVLQATAAGTVDGTEVVTATAAADAGAASQAVAYRHTASGWVGPAPIDPTPSVGTATPLAVCSDARALAVVGAAERRGIPHLTARPAPSPTGAPTTTIPVAGSAAGPDGQGDDGTLATAWSTGDGAGWTPATVSPLAGDGGGEAMDGCAATAAGFVAWGATPGDSGTDAPAIWTSTDGTTWTLTPSATLAAGSGPLTDASAGGATWYAVSGGAVAALSDPTDPTATVADPVEPPAVAAAATGADGDAAVWVSTDAGASWARAATTGPAWAAGGELRTDLVATAGRRVVVAGQVDGRLAVWTATP